VLKTLLQTGLTLGVGECLRGFDFLANGAIGFAFELMAAVNPDYSSACKIDRRSRFCGPDERQLNRIPGC
jgi:hypothetical protein